MPKFRVKWEEVVTETWEVEARDVEHATEIYNTDGKLAKTGSRDAGVVSVRELDRDDKGDVLQVVYCTIRDSAETGDSALLPDFFPTADQAKEKCQSIFDSERLENNERGMCLEWKDERQESGYFVAVFPNMDRFRIYEREVVERRQDDGARWFWDFE